MQALSFSLPGTVRVYVALNIAFMTPEKKVQMTRAAYDRLSEELVYLEGEGRQRISHEIGVARSHGDLSENAEYHAAREQQGLQEARIRQLRSMLQDAELIEAEDDGVVSPGKLVTVRYEGEAEDETYLLGLREERSDYDVLTPDSPMGRALVGRAVGDTVVAKVPAGELRVEVVGVRAP